MKGFRDLRIWGFGDARGGWRAVLASLAVVACLAGTAAAGGCPGATYVGQPASGFGLVCLGPCFCPTPILWGYWERQWQAWPGDQYRQDIVFPQSIGLERLGTPRGEQPKPLPREVYAKQKTKAEIDREMRQSAGTDLPIREGAPIEPLETPQPFDLTPQQD